MTEVNLQHTRWDTFVLPITIKADWVVVNLTWSTLTFSVRESIVTWSTLIFSCSWDIINASLWQAEINVDFSTMNSIAMGDYFYDVEMVDSLWVKLTILKWKLTIKYDVTRQ